MAFIIILMRASLLTIKINSLRIVNFAWNYSGEINNNSNEQLNVKHLGKITIILIKLSKHLN